MQYKIIVQSHFSLIWKLLTGVIAEDMFDCLEQEKFLSEEQKGCIRGSYGKKVQLLKYRVERLQEKAHKFI